MERYFEINRDGHNVRCVLFYNSISEIQKVIIFGHGFGGNKNNGVLRKFSEKILTKQKKVAVLSFDWPCHGEDVKKKLVLMDCFDYLKLVLCFVQENYHPESIYAYATSFGGFLFLNYIKKWGNPFRKIVLRCPAINMHEILTCAVIKNDDLEKLNKGKNVLVGFGSKIEISPQFMKDLSDADIFKTDFLEFADNILIIQGTKDEVVSYETVYRFADNNVIELVAVENADHRFQNPKHMEFATKAILSFYGF